jgi:hypothetical protein
VLSPQLVRSFSSGNGTWTSSPHGAHGDNGTASAPVTPARSTYDLLTSKGVTYGSPNPRSTPQQATPQQSRPQQQYQVTSQQQYQPTPKPQEQAQSQARYYPKPYQHHQRHPSNRSSRKSSNGSSRRHGSGTHPRTSYGGSNGNSGPRNDTLIGISEGLTVHEFAYRRGQGDHGLPSSTLPPNPFRAQYDHVWASMYTLGRQQGGVPLTHPIPATQQEHSNYAWAVLINPYTQSVDAPNGVIDVQWVRRMCEAALDCMEALVRGVCRHAPGWEKTVIDVPFPVREALGQFQGLSERYEMLKRDAKEALEGGRPVGY